MRVVVGRGASDVGDVVDVVVYHVYDIGIYLIGFGVGVFGCCIVFLL